MSLNKTLLAFALGLAIAACSNATSGTSEPQDIPPIERTGAFAGVYHVLGGALSPMDGVGPEDLHIAELLRHDLGRLFRRWCDSWNNTGKFGCTRRAR